MSFAQRNIVVRLATFATILAFFLIALVWLTQTDRYTDTNVFWLFGIVAVLAVVATIAATILTQMGWMFLQAARTNDPNPDAEAFTDERDELIDLRGTRLTYQLSSLGGLVASLAYVFGDRPLLMFVLFIGFGLAAQVAGDGLRLRLYARGT